MRTMRSRTVTTKQLHLTYEWQRCYRDVTTLINKHKFVLCNTNVQGCICDPAPINCNNSWFSRKELKESWIGQKGSSLHLYMIIKAEKGGSGCDNVIPGWSSL